MTSLMPPICFECKHFDEDKHDKGDWVCAAYPKGIPEKIIYSETDHTKPYKGDNGIQFEPK